MPLTTIILPKGTENWIFGAISKDLMNFTGGRILYTSTRKKQLLTRLKYKFFKPRGTVIILHQDILIKMVGNKNLFNCRIVLFFTHQSSYQAHSLRNLQLLKAADKIIVCSSEIKNFLVKKIGEVDESRIKVVIGGADISQFKLVDSNRNPNSVLFVSRLTERKRPDLILRTVKENPEYFFTLHGRDWFGSKFLNEMLLLPNFKFIDFDFQSANEIYNKCNIFMSLSDAEGAPMPALEALASGCKIILTDTGFAKDLIKISESVIVIPVNPTSEEIKSSLRDIRDLPLPDADVGQYFNYINFLKEFA